MNCLPGQWVSLSCWLSSMAAQDTDSKVFEHVFESRVAGLHLQQQFHLQICCAAACLFCRGCFDRILAQSLQLEVSDLCMGPAFQCSLRSRQQPSKLLKQKASTDFALGMRQADAGCLQLDSSVGL